MSERRPLIIGVDFDGTIVEHQFPNIGPPIPGAIGTLRTFVERGDKLVLWTMRSGPSLAKAVEYLGKWGVTLWGVNENPTQKAWTKSPKAYCSLYIDDAALGCPLVYPKGRRPYVDWYTIWDMLGLSISEDADGG